MRDPTMVGARGAACESGQLRIDGHYSMRTAMQDGQDETPSPSSLFTVSIACCFELRRCGTTPATSALEQILTPPGSADASAEGQPQNSAVYHALLSLS